MTDLSIFTLGRVVRQKNVDGILGRVSRSSRKKTLVHGLLGHIIGFDIVEYDDYYDTIVRVKWADGQEYSIHPSQVEVI